MIDFFFDRSSDSEDQKIPSNYNKHVNVIEFPSHEIDVEELLQNQASFSQIPISTVLERVEKGNILLQDLKLIFQSRIEMEDREIRHTSQLSKMSLSENEIPSSTMSSTLCSFTNYFGSLSQEQIRIRNEYEQIMAKDLSSYHSIYNHIVFKHKADIQKCLHHINTSSSQLLKLKQQFIKLLDESQKEGEKLLLSKKNLEYIIQQQNQQETSPSEDSLRPEREPQSLLFNRFMSVFDIPTTPEQEIEKQVHRIDRLDKEIEKKRKEMEEKKTQLLFSLEEKDRIWAATLKALETAEKSRLHHIELALKQFCQSEREFLERKLKLLNNLEKDVVEKMDISQDLISFAERETVVDHTHLYSHALKVMDWDYNRKTYGSSSFEDNYDWEGSGIWIDSAGIPSEESIHQIGNISSRDPTLAEVESEETERIGLLEIESSKGVETPVNFDTPPPLNEPIDSAEEVTLSLKSVSSESSFHTATANMNPLSSVNELVDVYLFPPLIMRNGNLTKINYTIESSVLIELCRRCFLDQEGRELFLQYLDDRRSRNSELSREQYERMRVAMKIFLDQCQESRDVKSALRIANMSITFHTRKSTPLSTPSQSPEIGTSEDSKHYLQQESDIVNNLIWKSDQFWEDSLVIGLTEQMEMMDRVRWDELEVETLREKIIAIHNIIFGQFGTIAFTMQEMGLSHKQVEKFVMSRSQGAQLGRDQQIELLKTIRITSKNNLNSQLKTDITASPPRSVEKNLEFKLQNTSSSSPASPVSPSSPASSSTQKQLADFTQMNNSTICTTAIESNDELSDPKSLDSRSEKRDPIVSKSIRESL